MNRSEHLQWCKDRANEYVDAGDFSQAFTSMVSDLNKHEETRSHPANQMGLALMMEEHLNTPEAMRKWIEGYN